MIVLRTPKGWTGPAEIDGKPVEGTWRAHQVPFADVRGNKDHMRMLEDWMRSYRPDELFEEDGRPRADLVDWLPSGDRSEEHTSELQSLMRISYAVFCLKKKN